MLVHVVGLSVVLAAVADVAHAGHESGNHWCNICWRLIQGPVGQFLQRSERVDDEAKETQASFVQAASDVEKKEAEEQSPTKSSVTTTQDDQVTATEHWKQRLGQLPRNEDFPLEGRCRCQVHSR